MKKFAIGSPTRRDVVRGIGVAGLGAATSAPLAGRAFAQTKKPVNISFWTFDNPQQRLRLLLPVYVALPTVRAAVPVLQTLMRNRDLSRTHKRLGAIASVPGRWGWLRRWSSLYCAVAPASPPGHVRRL